jgi:transcriptional regulator with XRE-family HTH domain
MIIFDIEILKVARKRLGLTQKQLAQKMGISHAQVNRIEKGKFAKPETIRLMAETLGEPIENVIIADDTQRVTLAVCSECGRQVSNN